MEFFWTHTLVKPGGYIYDVKTTEIYYNKLLKKNCGVDDIINLCKLFVTQGKYNNNGKTLSELLDIKIKKTIIHDTKDK